MELLHSGKVRDVWADGHELLLVASDRISVFDVVLPTPIPDKGAILTQLSLWWFERLADVAPHHVLSATDVPQQWAGRAVRCRRLAMLPVECIARGYLAGSAVADYRGTGAVQGVPLPPGVVGGAPLPEPVFTPTTKVAAPTRPVLPPHEAGGARQRAARPPAGAGGGGHAAGPGRRRTGAAPDSPGLPPGGRARRRARRDRGRPQARVRARRRRAAAARRRAADARLVAVLAAGGLAAGRAAAVVR